MCDCVVKHQLNYTTYLKKFFIIGPNYRISLKENSVLNAQLYYKKLPVNIPPSY